jgi:hypothetical protein
MTVLAGQEEISGNGVQQMVLRMVRLGGISAEQLVRGDAAGHPGLTFGRTSTVGNQAA